ncbi:MAG: helix-turn-helix transcriptional regulator [Pseudomonadota bacterium]
MDKRDRVRLFRTRLSTAMQRAGLSQSALARATGVDRSTVSQLLSGDTPRLPNAQVVAECATALSVSGDWLLGLSARPEQADDILAASMQLSQAPRALVDEQIFHWHREAAGYKIRHVPAKLPDMLKTPAMLRWEYGPHLGKTADQAIGASQDRLDWMQQSQSDYEIAMPIFEVASLMECSGYYNELPKTVRDAQLAHLIDLHDRLFPTLRVFLFDARRVFSAPITVFGPLLAVVYLGEHYMAFRDTERVGLFTRQFDRLVREAWVDAREFPQYLERLGRAT